VSAPIGPQHVAVSLRVVDQILLPAQTGGLTYTFGYNGNSGPSQGYSNGWGELSSVTLPSGAQAVYQFLQDGQNSVLFESVLNNSLTRKDLTYLLEYDGSSTPQTETWTYSFDPVGQSWGSVTGPDGGVNTENFNDVFGSIPFMRERWDYGLSLATIRANGTKTNACGSRIDPTELAIATLT